MWESLSPQTQEHLEHYWRPLIEELSVVEPYDRERSLPILLVAIYGGTNTGKSAIFNLLMDSEISPSKIIASATRQPVIALSEGYSERLDFIERFRPFSSKTEILNEPHTVEEASCYLHAFSTDHGPLGPLDGGDHLALIDCPDHDSSTEMNREVAELTLSYADRCLYVTTAQKYKTKAVRDTLINLANKGLLVGVLFNLLEPHQEAQALWDDLLQALERQGEDLTALRTQVYLAGGLPRASLQDQGAQIKLRAMLLESLTHLIGDQDPRVILRREALTRAQRVLVGFQQQVNELIHTAERDEKRIRESLLRHIEEVIKENAEHPFFQRLRDENLKHNLQQISHFAYIYRYSQRSPSSGDRGKLPSKLFEIHQVIDQALWRALSRRWSHFSGQPIAEALREVLATLYTSPNELSSLERAWSKETFHTALEALSSSLTSPEHHTLFKERQLSAESTLTASLDSNPRSLWSGRLTMILEDRRETHAHQSQRARYDIINTLFALFALLLSHSLFVTLITTISVALSQSLITRLLWLRRMSARGELLDEATKRSLKGQEREVKAAHHMLWTESAPLLHPQHIELKRLHQVISEVERDLTQRGEVLECS